MENIGRDGLTCDVCGSSFTMRKNLLRHRRMKHGLDIMCKDETTRKHARPFNCNDCPALFGLKRNLLRHIRTKHGAPSDDPPSLAALFECHSCGFKSPRKDVVKDHIFRKHMHESARSSARPRCPICGLQGFRDMLVKHFEKDHNIEITMSTYEFENESEFSVWKSSIEQENANEFTKIYHYRAVDGGKFELYRCHRDGFYKGRGRNLRRRTGSNKIGGHCPSAMRVRVDPSGNVNVSFCRTHVGHLGEESRLRAIKRERRQRLQEKRQIKRLQRLGNSETIKFRPTDLDEVAHEIVVHDVDLDRIEFHYEIGNGDAYSEELLVQDQLQQAGVILTSRDDLKFVDLESERRRLLDAFAQIVSQAETTDDVALIEASLSSLLNSLQERRSFQLQRQFALLKNT